MIMMLMLLTRLALITKRKAGEPENSLPRSRSPPLLSAPALFGAAAEAGGVAGRESRPIHLYQSAYFTIWHICLLTVPGLARGPLRAT